MATLYDVDAKGGRSKVAIRRAKYEDGRAQVEFSGLPAPSHHYRVAFKLRAFADTGALSRYRR